MDYAAYVYYNHSYLVFLSSTFLIVLEDVVSHIILWIDEELLSLPFFIAALHPNNKQQHQN